MKSPFLFLTLLVGTGCYEWYEVSGTLRPVWSEDDARIYYVEEAFEQRVNSEGSYFDRNVRFTLWEFEPDTQARTPVFSRQGRDARIPRPLVFRSKGRVLLDRGCREILDLDLKTLEFRTVAQADKCDLRYAIPDPSGDILALASRPDGEPTTLTMLEWDTLEPVWGPQEVPRAEPDGWWTPEGDFFVGESLDDASVAYLWSPDGTISLVPRPECRPPRSPATTSSAISADGVILCGGFGEDVHECTREEIDNDWGTIHPSIPLLPFGCPDGAP